MPPGLRVCPDTGGTQRAQHGATPPGAALIWGGWGLATSPMGWGLPLAPSCGLGCPPEHFGAWWPCLGPGGTLWLPRRGVPGCAPLSSPLSARADTVTAPLRFIEARSLPARQSPARLALLQPLGQSPALEGGQLLGHGVGESPMPTPRCPGLPALLGSLLLLHLHPASCLGDGWGAKGLQGGPLTPPGQGEEREEGGHGLGAELSTSGGHGVVGEGPTLFPPVHTPL